MVRVIRSHQHHVAGLVQRPQLLTPFHLNVEHVELPPPEDLVSQPPEDLPVRPGEMAKSCLKMNK